MGLCSVGQQQYAPVVDVVKGPLQGPVTRDPLSGKVLENQPRMLQGFIQRAIERSVHNFRQSQRRNNILRGTGDTASDLGNRSYITPCSSTTQLLRAL